MSCSSPTGPAFEGAQIAHGQRAAPGAIERVRIDRKTGEPRFKVIGNERWSDEQPPDEIKATGICGSGIIEVVAELFVAGILRADGRFEEWRWGLVNAPLPNHPIPTPQFRVFVGTAPRANMCLPLPMQTCNRQRDRGDAGRCAQYSVGQRRRCMPGASC